MPHIVVNTDADDNAWWDHAHLPEEQARLSIVAQIAFSRFVDFGEAFCASTTLDELLKWSISLPYWDDDTYEDVPWTFSPAADD